jgi:hypothetical protein
MLSSFGFNNWNEYNLNPLETSWGIKNESLILGATPSLFEDPLPKVIRSLFRFRDYTRVGDENH